MQKNILTLQKYTFILVNQDYNFEGLVMNYTQGDGVHYPPVVSGFWIADLGVYFSHRTQVSALSTERARQSQTLKLPL